VSPGRTRYDELRAAHPHLFANPPDAAYVILTDPADVAAAERAAAERLRARGLPTGWAVTGVVYEDQYLLIVRDAVRMPNGSLGTYIREVAPDDVAGVVMVPVIDGRVVLVRLFRHSARAWRLEFPRGFGTPGATAEDDARRELTEEIGAEIVRMVDLGDIEPDGSGTPVRLFLAELSAYGEAEAAEGISELRLVTPAELAALVGGGEITDLFTLSAYARAVARGLLTGPA
jgi:ADP-ribose pyrophosphatase